MNDPLIPTSEAARIHDVTTSTIRKWVQRGLLKSPFKIGGTSYYRLSDVDEAEWKARTRDTTGRAQTRLDK